MHNPRQSKTTEKGNSNVTSRVTMKKKMVHGLTIFSHPKSLLTQKEAPMGRPKYFMGYKDVEVHRSISWLRWLQQYLPGEYFKDQLYST
jgi:hypothetical protein